MSNIKSHWLSNGLAMFSMFFGAGNLIFPLIVGQYVQGNIFYALMGLVITAIIIPFSGLMSITLFQGDYIRFFKRIGRIPGAIITVLILCLIGPFGGIPRVITFTYSTMHVSFPSLSLIWFSVAFSAVVFLFCIKKQRILDLLGYLLTPLLLISLIVIVVKGIFFSDQIPSYEVGKSSAFIYGLVQGYNTMDLLAAFFFSSVVCMRYKEENIGRASPHYVTIHLLKSSLVGAFLLALVYIGFGFVAAVYSEQLATVAPDHFLGAIGSLTLGPMAAFVIASAVALSCLTTAIALVLVSEEFISMYIFRGKVPYIVNLLLVLIVTIFVSSLEFSGIVAFIAPILQVCYPALLVLSVLNLLYKLFGFKPVKVFVFVVFAISVVFRFIQH